VTYRTVFYGTDQALIARTRDAMRKNYNVTCQCTDCCWSMPVDLLEVDYFSLEELKDDMACPQCRKTGLRVTVTHK
jgi:Zn finger protein HypA/HybF involved in hydrogenase expression